MDAKAAVKAVSLVRGDIEPGFLFDKSALETIEAKLSALPESWHTRQKTREAYNADPLAPWPERPDLTEPVLMM